MKLIYGVFGLALLFVHAGCGGESSAGKKSQIKPKLQFPVEVLPAEARESDFSIHAIGSVEAFEIVPITARVSGVVERVHFKEGDRVSEGAQLLAIEPERFALNLKSSEAQYEKACASLAEAQAGLYRRTDIQTKNPGWVSSEELQDWETRVRTLQADSAYAHTALELARLNLRDSHIPSPAGGVIQSRTVRTGQFVQTGTVVATLVRRDPLLLRLNVPEQESRKIHPGLKVKFTTGDRTNEFEAIVIAVTEAADITTRMVSVTADITDPRRDQLRPGAFAEAAILLGESSKLPVIPQTAIRPSERGFLAFVVQDTVARERILQLGMQSADGTVEVRGGISAGELVVIRGAEALRDGVPVRVVTGKKEENSGAARDTGRTAS